MKRAKKSGLRPTDGEIDLEARQWAEEYATRCENTQITRQEIFAAGARWARGVAQLGRPNLTGQHPPRLGGGSVAPDCSPEQYLASENNALRKAGCKLAEAALYVAREYDGVHRLMLAVAEWAKAVADEGGRGRANAHLSGGTTSAPSDCSQGD